ncbi:MAG: RDD family protein [Firmicutes bacterium]|nr:RDD family protein [Bacillota bacterium]
MERHNSDLLKRYKKSISIDTLMCMLPEVLFGLFFPAIKNIFQDSIHLVLICTFLLSFLIYLFLDIIFLKRSLGKRLYRLVILKQSEDRKVKYFHYVYRRFLELAIHSLFTRTFSDKCRIIEQATHTRIDYFD